MENNCLCGDIEVVSDVMTFPFDEEILPKGLETVKVLLDLQLDRPVEVVDELDELRGIIPGRGSLLKASVKTLNTHWARQNGLKTR